MRPTAAEVLNLDDIGAMSIALKSSNQSSRRAKNLKFIQPKMVSIVNEEPELNDKIKGNTLVSNML